MNALTTNKVQYGYATCPACNEWLLGGMIPIERRGLYDGAEYYSRAIFVTDDRYCCPQCKYVFTRPGPGVYPSGPVGD